MRTPNRLAEPGSSVLGPLLAIAVMLSSLSILVAAWAASVIGARLGGRDDAGSLRDFGADLLQGDVVWGGGETAVLAILVVLLVGLGVLIGVPLRAAFTPRTRVDGKAPFMATSKSVALLREAGAVADAQRLRASHAGPGVPIGTMVGQGGPLRAPWEWVQLWIMGPRAGKTTCVCIPQILETEGPVLATSNKRDIVDGTRGPRSMKGLVWVFDVQDLIGEQPTWWWNPLSFVVDVQTADELVDLFISSATEAGARQDAYFSSAARSVLSAMILAAALDDRPITDVVTWLYDVSDETPLTLLSRHDQAISRRVLQGAMDLTEKQRDGVYGTAHPWVAFLRNAAVLPWITAQGPNDPRPQFDPHAFAASTDTIYLISREGAGSAAAVTGALTMATLKAAEQLGSRQRGGRLATPMLAVLDEAANVVRWRALPDLYSHYGSRGIILSTFLQSWAQGVAAWGDEGMNKLYSATNIAVVGPGNAQDSFIRTVSERIGDYDVRTRSVTSSVKGARSTSTSLARRRLFDVADLMAMPAGRAVAFSSGMPPILLDLVHHSRKPYADLVKESFAYYEGLAVNDGRPVDAPSSPLQVAPAPSPFRRDPRADAVPADLLDAGALSTGVTR